MWFVRLIGGKEEPVGLAPNDVSALKLEGPRHVVVLVHGTWARNAEWIADGDLRSSLEDSGAAVLAFRWSGANTHSARRQAASELVSEMRRLHAQLPDSRLSIVAHSHGGHVARIAVDELEADVGVVTLSTPFIGFVPRSIERWGYLLAVSVVMALFAAFGADISTRSRVLIAAALAPVAVALLLVAVAHTRWKIKGFSRWDMIRSPARRIEALATVTTPLSNADRSYAVHIPGDEAGLGLSVAAFFSAIARPILESPIGQRIERWLSKSITVLISVAVIAGVVSRQELSETTSRVVTAVLVVAVVPLVGYTFAQLIAVGAALSAAAPFGVDGTILGLSGEFTVSQTTPGTQTVFTVDSTEPRHSFLAHSDSYENKAAIAHIVEWLQE
jgi:predicted alpha/beta-hydrolase family hydrolase